MPVLLVGLSVIACSNAGDERVDKPPNTTTSPSEDADVQGTGRYEPGDCVTWDAGERPIPANIEIVPCEQPHRVQIVAHLGSPDTKAGDFPSEAVWDEHQRVNCSPAIESFLGEPLDPYGRFTDGTLIPSIVQWAAGDRDVWCGIWLNAPDDALHTGDVRDADQATNYPPGTCVAGNRTREIEVVPCTQPHFMEIIVRLTYENGGDPPDEQAREAMGRRCNEAVDDYTGGSERLPAPWASGLEKMHSESWQAGTRTVHCFLGQIDANNEWIPVTGPAPR